MGFHNANPIVENAFMNGESKKYSNSATDGKILLLFGNRIAEHREDGVYITNCGWFTNTTKSHLNVLPNVSIYQRKKQWYLNGEIWNGDWIKISNEIVTQKSQIKGVFDTTTKWVSNDAWRGYNEPIYAVCGANDTGSWGDSPCPTYVCDTELKEAIKALKGIPIKCITTESSNVFCAHRYVIVPPNFIDEARRLFAEYYETVKDKTRLLYAV